MQATYGTQDYYYSTPHNVRVRNGGEPISPNDAILVRIRIGLAANAHEDIWAWLHQDDREDYVNKVRDVETTRLAVVASRANFATVKWGAYIPIRLTGGGIPVCSFLDLVASQEFNPVYHSEIAAQMLERYMLMGISHEDKTLLERDSQYVEYQSEQSAHPIGG